MVTQLGMLDLFSGVGGFTMGLRSFTTTKAYCDNDKIAQGVLRRQMKAGLLDRAKIFDDVKKLHVRDLPDGGDGIEVVTAGFPCQDISVAGLRAGLAKGARSSLYKQVFRLVSEFGAGCTKPKTKGNMKFLKKVLFSRRRAKPGKPSYLFLENVSGITSKGDEYRSLLKSLDDLGYDAFWDHYSAAGSGAVHRRKRWFLLAARRFPAPVKVEVKEDKALTKWLYDGTQKFSESAIVPGGDKAVDSEKKQGIASMALLGNAVVPAQANKAFRGLLSRLLALQQDEKTDPVEVGVDKIPTPGAYVRGEFVEAKLDADNVEPLAPAGGGFSYDIKRERGARPFKASTPILYGLKVLTFLGTPRRMHARASAPTKRGLNDFGTSVAYCKRLAKNVDPRGAVVKSTFAEAAMGFPPGWTADPELSSVVRHLVVELGLGPDAPLMVKYNLESADKGHMQFYLAPKIDE
jgi:hypothetical protein